MLGPGTDVLATAAVKLLTHLVALTTWNLWNNYPS